MLTAALPAQRCTRSRRRGGSDHTSFNEAGLPGIGVGQDPIEYGTYTWHTNLDTYERVIESDAQASAMAIAGAVYHLAMRDEKLPRFTKEQMPATPDDNDTVGQSSKFKFKVGVGSDSSTVEVPTVRGSQ